MRDSFLLGFAFSSFIPVVICAPIQPEYDAQAGLSLGFPVGPFGEEPNVQIHSQQHLEALQSVMLTGGQAISASNQEGSTPESVLSEDAPYSVTSNAALSPSTTSTPVQAQTPSISTTSSTSSSSTPVASGLTQTSASTPSQSSAPSPSPSGLPLPAATPQVMAYYPDWAGNEFPPEKIDFTRFDWIDFAFAIPTKDGTLSWDDATTAPNLLRRLVDAAHANGKKVKLSIGGWTGSRFFSSCVATNDSRHVFATNIRSMYDQFQLDGIDIDWEYPGRQGEADNEVSSADSMNFLAFLQALREILPSEAKISAATQAFPFADPQGQSMHDVREFSKVLDWLLLMNYDIWGSSANPGPNAPFYDACGNSTQPDANLVAAYNAWTNAGFLPSKLVAGLPAYGYISKSTAETLRVRSKRLNHQHRARTLRVTRVDAIARDEEGTVVRVTGEDGGDSGQVQFRDLIGQGALARNTNTKSMSIESDTTSDPMFVGAGGFTRHWDGCSSTTFITSKAVEQVITYDDPESLRMKAAFVKEMGMFGVNIFDVHGDTDDWVLVDGTRKGLGLS